MKKLFSSILCLVLVLALSSCSGLLERFESIGGSLLDTSKTENGVAQGEYTPGAVTDSDWKSAWIGLQYTLTDGFSMMSQEELEELMDLATGIYKDPETGKELIDYAKVNAIYEMQAMDNMGNNVIVMAEKVNFLVNSEEKYCDALKQQLGQQTNMSGTFEDLDVPPTLVSFAVTTGKVEEVISPEFKKAGSRVYLIAPEYSSDKLPKSESLISVFNKVTALMREGKVLSAYTPGIGGVSEAVMKMCFGNGFGFKYNSDEMCTKCIFGYNYGAFLLETTEEIKDARLVGFTTDDGNITFETESVPLSQLLEIYENKLESVYSCNIPDRKTPMENFSFSAEERVAPAIKVAKPKVLIPAFPGTNCEFDSAKAVRDAGGDPEIIVINNLTSAGIRESIDYFAKQLKDAQMVFVPGGFSGGDEPDGSGKFITAFFRNAEIKDGVTDLLENRDGLMCGICNGFQALIKLGLVPYGKIIDTDENCPTLTFNTIARHQSRIVRTRIASNKSPWLALTEVDDVYNVAISHGEGRFLASEELIKKLAENGQIATQYVDFEGNATSDVHFNPNDSMYAIEGITSPDGRVFGKMGHSERIGEGLYKNVPGNYDIRMFESAIRYFK